VSAVAAGAMDAVY